MFEPGTGWQYSNTNTVLLSLILEQVTGKPIDQLYRKWIIKPLHLRETSFPNADPTLPEPHAQGYTLVYGRALGTGKGLLPREQQADRLTSFLYGLPPNTANRAYGLGLGNQRGWLGHTGELPGYTTTLYYHTELHTTVVVEVNSDIATGDCPPDTPTMTDGPHDIPCSDPAVRISGALAEELGKPLRSG